MVRERWEETKLGLVSGMCLTLLGAVLFFDGVALTTELDIGLRTESGTIVPTDNFLADPNLKGARDVIGGFLILLLGGRTVKRHVFN